MSGHPTRSGRHSLPPLSSILTPVTSRGQNTTGSGGRSRDSGAGNTKPPLPTSLSLGNLRTTRYMSENGPNSARPAAEASSTKVDEPTTATKEEKKDKKKRKKGMKGWAWVVEDENGNVIDLPSDEEIAFRNAANNEQTIRPPVSRAEEVKSDNAPDAVMITGEDGEHLKADVHSPSSQASTTAREDVLLGKRPFKSSSPTRACSPQNLTESSSPKSMAFFTTLSGEEPRRKVRRKSSPPTTAVTSTPAATPSDTTRVIMTIPIPSTTTPTALPTASKTVQSRRTQPSRQPPPPTRARAVVAQRDSTSRAGSAHIVNDDAPLAVPPIRIGSGQGFNSHNKESAAKEELALRKEALFIIDQAEKMRATSYERGKRSGVTKRGGRRNGKADDVGIARDKESLGDRKSFIRNHDYSDDDNWDSLEGSSEGRQERPALGSRLSSQTAKAPPALPPPRPFEVEFEEVQEYYRQKAEASRTSRLRERPLSERHSPVVVIATNGQDAMPRDETERGYYQGLSGLTEEMEANASGFVHNVRANVTALATYYFPQRQAKRDAFLERIGRGLQKLGQELTDNGDALVLP